MATIIIEGESFEYENIHLSDETNSVMSHVFAKALLLKVKDVFDKHDLKFSLAYGTLLGAVRDKDFINGDKDIDIYTWDLKKLLLLVPKLYEDGIKLCRIIEGRLYSFMYQNSCYIDVYIVKPYKCSIWGIYCYNLAGYATPKKYFKEMQGIEFQEVTFQCTKNPVNILRFWYGKTWNIPIHNKKYIYEVYSSHIYKKIKNRIKKLIVYDK
jgi:phosphorylcholine metabolism protein LicD